MSTTIPFPFRKYPKPEYKYLDILIERYESALGDADHATDTEDAIFYEATASTMFDILALLLEVPDKDVVDYLA